MGQTAGVEEKLQAAEEALQRAGLVSSDPENPNPIEGADARTQNLVGQIAAARATLALTRYQTEKTIAQAQRALVYLHPANLPFRATTLWTLGIGYIFKGDRTAARRSFTEALSIGPEAGSHFSTLLATIGLGGVQELDNQLYEAAETYRHAIQLAGEPALAIAYDPQLGMARISYEWNDLEAAELHAQRSLQLARQYDRVIDRYIVCEVFLARLKLARGDLAGAAAMLAQTDQTARQKNFVLRFPEIAAAQVLLLLRQGNLAAAAQLAQTYDLPISQARLQLARGDPSAALAVLTQFHEQMEAKGWQDELLKAMVLQAVALHTRGDTENAVQLLRDALMLAEPGGFIRLFVDEGLPMAQLLSRMKDDATQTVASGGMREYVHKLLAAFGEQKDVHPSSFSPQPLVEPLSPRELEVLHLMAQGLSNQEIAERLFLALDTVKGHNRRIFDKLQVQRRTEAVARARELGLL
jgi:ATP/maltotriose-dependent transcriptional regulator MalT